MIAHALDFILKLWCRVVRLDGFVRFSQIVVVVVAVLYLLIWTDSDNVRVGLFWSFKLFLFASFFLLYTFKGLCLKLHLSFLQLIFLDCLLLVLVYLYQLILRQIRRVLIVTKEPSQVNLSVMVPLREMVPTPDLHFKFLIPSS